MSPLQVYAVFGFCDIRQFTDATEVLQEEVMEFVNSIAKIVHMEVSLHGGFPNKNIGDAFLLVRSFDYESRVLYARSHAHHGQQAASGTAIVRGSGARAKGWVSGLI